MDNLKVSLSGSFGGVYTSGNSTCLQTGSFSNIVISQSGSFGGIICKGKERITDTTATTNLNNGALVVDGGSVIKGSLHVGSTVYGYDGIAGHTGACGMTWNENLNQGEINATIPWISFKDLGVNSNCKFVVNNVTDATNASTASLITKGGLGVAKKLYIADSIVSTDTTDATSTTSGSIRTAGGISCQKSFYCGGGADFGNITYDGLYSSQSWGLFNDSYGNYKFQSGAPDTASWHIDSNGNGGNAQLMFLYNKLSGTPCFRVMANADATSASSAGSVFEGGVGIGGKLYTGGDIVCSKTGTFSQLQSNSIKFADATSTVLNYHEDSYSHETSWSGIWASSQTGNCVITRIGKMVNITIPTTVDTANTASTITNTVVLPARFRPSTTITGACRVADNNSTIFGSYAVQNDGYIIFYAGATLSSNFAGSGTSGILRLSITYCV